MDKIRLNKYSKEDVVALMNKMLVFTLHAVDRMRLETRDLTRIEIEEAIRRGEIIAQYEYPESGYCDEVQIQSYNPAIFVSAGMCEERLVVITTWRGIK